MARLDGAEEETSGSIGISSRSGRTIAPVVGGRQRGCRVAIRLN